MSYCGLVEICILIVRQKSGGTYAPPLMELKTGYCIKRTSTNVMTPNSAPKTMVALAKSSSIPFFLPPKSVSAPPAIDPDRPALFPDWRTTAAINVIEMTASRIINAVIKIWHPPNFTCTFYHKLFRIDNRYFDNSFIILMKKINKKKTG